MVVNNDEKDFKGKTLQEYLSWNYPTKEDREKVRILDVHRINFKRRWEYKRNEQGIVTKLEGITEKLEGGELDLSEYVNLERIVVTGNNCKPQLTKLTLGNKLNLTFFNFSKNQLTTLDLSNCPNLTFFDLSENNLTSIDFLKQLPHPKKLEKLWIFDNNIEPTDLDFLRPFVNLKSCKLGENMGLSKPKQVLKERLENGTYNKFYGSLEPIKSLTNLSEFCVAATDVEEGIEYIPSMIAESSKGKGERAIMLNLIDCQPLREDAKVAKIQNELRVFDYDISAWQLAHPEKMLISRPELFTNSDSKDKWLTALNGKILQVREEIIIAKQNEANKLFKITRLEATIQELDQAKSTISQQTQTEFSTQDKGTQTDLTAEQIANLEQQNEQLKKLLTATEQELANTEQQLKLIQEKIAELTNSTNYLTTRNEEITQNITNLQEQIKQLTSKIKLLKQQKETYQTKYDSSAEFTKEIREDIKNM